MLNRKSPFLLFLILCFILLVNVSQLFAHERENQYTEHRIMIGMVFHFGAYDLLTQDRYGVTLDTPDFGRWISSFESIND